MSKTRPLRKRTGRRFAPLPLLAGLLIASCVLRLNAVPARAIAQDIAEAMQPQAETPAGTEPQAEGRIAELLASLEAQSERLTEQESALADREAAVAEAEAAISEQLSRLEAAEGELSEVLKLASSAAEDDLTKLTSVYETMKPAEAAALFSQMEPTFAAGFLSRMRPDSAAAVMSGLDPELAYAISLMLAGRHAGVPQ